ncbi:MAG TPA: hypothetical protein VFO76_09580, partial [Candidatus Kapabacteria bacterium]|nr:hypothetical protein [Candidatus Kapabacteria bacterium]
MKNLFSPLLWILASFVVLIVPLETLSAQTFKTNNVFIYGVVEGTTGLITVMLPNGRVGTDGQLNFYAHSYFSCNINNQVFTNNDVAGKPANAGVGWQLNDGQSNKTGDTIFTVWVRSGVQITQEVFPIAFSRSGQIMIRWRFANPTASTVKVACQYLNDIAIVDPHDPSLPNADDGPILFYPNSYRDAWQRIPSAAMLEMPPFYVGFLRDLPNANPGISALGNLDNPSLGTIKPSQITIGDWTIMANTSFGHPTPDWLIGTALGSDNAILIEFPFQSIASKSTALVGATTYGTSELEMCNNAVFALANYPHTLIWNSTANKYPVTTIPLDLYIINLNPWPVTGTVDITTG